MSTAQEDNSTLRPQSSETGPQQGPVPMFELHLKILSDSYLSFFQERIRIEETYIDSLTKLHRKVKIIDSFLDDRGDQSTTRNAWREVRDNIEREAQARQAFLSTLTIDVLIPLSTLRETQDRTRKRIKEDLKDSATAHSDYVENTLPRLKRIYLKKCQDVEDYKLAAATTSVTPNQPLSPSSASFQPLMQADISKPIVTSPQPLRPLARRPSGQASTAIAVRNRSPSTSTSTALSDLAHQGKKQLNQLKTFLDKGGVTNQASGKADGALRSVRARREADEADKEYRKGVHWLETLRLRRVKILEGGYKSLELFIRESAETVKLALEKYTDNLIATCTTHTQLSTHARSAVSQISPEKDASALAAQIPRSLASATPKPILYYNYGVGECRDLIFGVSLVDYSTARGLSDSQVPKIVRMCIKELEERGLDMEGIYRVSGRLAVVQDLMHKIERDERKFEFHSTADDVYAVSSLLKLYLRELPEPVFRFPLQDRVQHTEDREEHMSNNFLLLRSKIRRLPAVHQAVLKTILEHLALIASRSDKNKMDAKNLSIVFGSVIFGEDEMSKSTDILNSQTWKDTLMEDLVVHARTLFDDRWNEPSPSSPPLPAAPSGEPVPSFSYGSSYTQIATVPPTQLRARQQSSHAEDFTPPLPPRPTNSIHPSLRTNASNTTTRVEGVASVAQRLGVHVPPQSSIVDTEGLVAITCPGTPVSDISPSSATTFTTAASSPVDKASGRLPSDDSASSDFAAGEPQGQRIARRSEDLPQPPVR